LEAYLCVPWKQWYGGTTARWAGLYQWQRGVTLREKTSDPRAVEKISREN